MEEQSYSYPGPKILVYYDKKEGKFVKLIGQEAEDYLDENGQEIGFT